METSIYYFDALPLCPPPPQPLESFTSYLTRVAEANRIRYPSRLKPFIYQYSKISNLADYAPPTFDILPTLTRRSESELLKTTFFHVGQKFRRLHHSSLLAIFLNSIIAPSLRFCPLCLQDALYYALPWRFLPLRGCPKHACGLLEICELCNHRIPIFSSPLRIGICPRCNKDLRLCIPPSLTEAQLQKVSMTYREIEFLLSPYSWETTESVSLEKLGMEFSLIRHAKQLTLVDVAKQAGLSQHTLQAIEYGQANAAGASLRWYIEYAHYLGISLNSLFTAMLQREAGDRQVKMLRLKRFFLEDEVLEHVQEVVGCMRTSGISLTLKTIGTATGISPESLKKHHQVRDYIKGVLDGECKDAPECRPESEEDLLAKAQQVIKEFAKSGQPITQTSVSLRLGIRPETVSLYPMLKRFIQQHVDYASQQFKRSRKREKDLLEKVRSAVDDLKAQNQPVTYIAVSKILGINYLGWTVYAQVRAFVDQNLDSRYLDNIRKQKEREEALLPRVEEAIKQLEAQGEPVRFQAIGKLLGIKPTTLKAYPRVSLLIEQKGDTSLRKRRAGRSEEEMLIKVQKTIQELTNRGQAITYASVAREIGIGPATLKTYAQIKALLDEHLQSYHLYERQQFSLREETLLYQVEKAIAELEALNMPVTQPTICAKINQDRAVFKRYPRVRALIEQRASGYHALQRLSAQLTEEELMQKVEEAVAGLVSLGKRVTQISIARFIKKSSSIFAQYPLVVDYLENNGYKRRKEREDKIAARVEEAVKLCKTSGRSITIQELTLIMDVKRTTLTYYPSVRAIITQAINEDQQQRKAFRFQKRENELAQQVANAIQQLQIEGKKVSVLAVGGIVHVSSNCLRYYPKVSAFLVSAIATQRAANESEQN